MALARTLDVDLATLQQEAAAAAAAGAPIAAVVPFQPAAAAEADAATAATSPAAAAEAAAAVGAPAVAVAAATAAAADDGSPEVSDEDLDASDTERETEAAVAPYIARLSPTGPAPLQAILEAGEAVAAAGVLAAQQLLPAAEATGAAADAAAEIVAAAAVADPGPSQTQPVSAVLAPESQTPVTRAAARRRRQAQQAEQQAEQQQQAEGQPVQQPQLSQPMAVRVLPVQLHLQEGEGEAAAGPSTALAASPPETPALPASPSTPAHGAAAAAASVAAETEQELMPWAKAEAMVAREQRLFSAGAMSSATLRFVSPRLEAQFGAAHAAFLTRWVRQSFPNANDLWIL